MAEIETTDDRRSIVTPDLRLTFRWAGDRWAHALESGDGPSRIGLAHSVEGDPGRDDPGRVVSPAYQQLGFQASASGMQALLVGQSGSHHFSAVFTVEERADGVVVEVDVADRCRGPVAALACTYGVQARSGDLLDADPRSITWEEAEGRGRLAFESAGPSARLSMAEAGRVSTRVQAVAEIIAGASTHRCLYRWRSIPTRPRPLAMADPVRDVITANPS